MQPLILGSLLIKYLQMILTNIHTLTSSLIEWDYMHCMIVSRVLLELDRLIYLGKRPEPNPVALQIEINGYLSMHRKM